MTIDCTEWHIPPRPVWLVTAPDGYLLPDTLVDDGGTVKLREGTRNRLIGKLMSYRDATKHEIIVWVADAPLEPGVPMEQWCLVTAKAWGGGRKGYNDGVTIFLFPSPPQDRFRMRVEVGRGLEQVLTSREANRLAHKWGPVIEGGKHDEGIDGLVDDIIAVIGRK
jgi:uncharacterized membrane protein YgcG